MFKIEHNTETSHVFSFQVPKEVADVFDGSEGIELNRGSFEIVPVYEPGEPVKLRLTVVVRETEVRGDA